ncbi:MAG TPA: DedA family protein [Hyphomicrobiaceae bacterium]
MLSFFAAGGWTEYLLTFASEHARFIALLVFVLGFTESIVLISLFVPSSVLFLGIGAIHSAAGGEFWPIWVAGATGAWAGDCVSYALGRYFKDDAGKVWPMRKFPGFIPKGQMFCERWGVLGIVLGKFIGGLRPFVPVVAGMLSMPWALFLPSSGLSCLIWAGAFLAPGYGISFIVN